MFELLRATSFLERQLVLRPVFVHWGDGAFAAR